MQSSYNLIKNSSTLKACRKSIETNYISKKEIEEKENNILSVEDEIKKNYEVLGSKIIERAKIESEKIIMEARNNKIEIEKTAYEKGYSQGKANGYEDGYNEGFQKVKLDTENEVKVRIEKAEFTLNEANKKYKEYLTYKEQEILRLSFKMASIIAKKELQISKGIIPLIENILEEAKGEENIIIRCNNVHIKDINEKINYYKKAYAIKGEIFLLEDELMEPGNAIIDKGTGKAKIGLDIALEKLEEALFK